MTEMASAHGVVLAGNLGPRSASDFSSFVHFEPRDPTAFDKVSGTQACFVTTSTSLAYRYHAVVQ